jgi:hypothetical protein
MQQGLFENVLALRRCSQMHLLSTWSLGLSRDGERDGTNMSTIEYTQKHWNEFREEYPEILTAILPDDIQLK